VQLLRVEAGADHRRHDRDHEHGDDHRGEQRERSCFV
jgi:hypothetical protein